MRVIFTGTSDFAVPSLEAVIAAPQHDILAVITQPDRPRGRGREMQMSPIKEVALEHSIPLMQPERIGGPESVAAIKELGPVGAMIVVAYGQKITPELLAWPGQGVVNVHGSILPKYRGAAPIQHALLYGEKQTGVTTMLMDEGWDTGDILLQDVIDIAPGENAGELSERLALLGSRLLVKTLNDIESGSISPIRQDDDLATIARSLEREAGYIDWSQPADVTVNRVRGCTPRPGAYTRINGVLVKVYHAEVVEPECRFGEPGEIVDISDRGIAVAAGSGSVRLVEVQAESRKRMPAAEFARGGKLDLGARFDVRAVAL